MLVMAAMTTLLAGAALAQTRSADLDIATSDGATLGATYTSPGTPGPGLLLLHQCNMDRKAWVKLTGVLVARGVHVLAFDYRDVGDSPGPLVPEKLPGDVDAAFATLKAQPGVDATRLAAGGASCGVNHAVRLASRTPQVKALLLFSGTTWGDGMAFLEKRPALPIFGGASLDDGKAVPNIRALVGLSSHHKSVMRELPEGGHGAPMFDAQPELMAEGAAWLSEVLR